MSNLTNNTASLQAILNTINELPEAGQGGTNTSDATVTANDLAQGVIAYGKDGKVTGTLQETYPSSQPSSVNYSESTVGNATVKSIILTGTALNDVICRKNQQYSLGAYTSEFGDATTADVAEGKTFTSADGVKMVGTGSLKMFTWEKYSTTSGTTSDAYSQQEITNKVSIKLSHTQQTLYSTMSFNANTGIYTLSNATTNLWGTIYNDKIYQSHPYYYIDDAHTRIAKIGSMTPPKTGAIVQTYNATYTEYYSLANEQGVVKGSYIEDVTSTYSHEYPADGYQDGYWYVLKSEGGSGSLEGLENGYDVMFYDENNEGLAFYSIKQGHSINAPVYNCKAWQTVDGENVEFPYTPTEDVIFYANNNTYASMLYEFYGVDSAVFPYLIIRFDGQYGRVLFAKTFTDQGDKFYIAQYLGGMTYLSSKPSDYSDIESVISWVTKNVTVGTNVNNYNTLSYSNNYLYVNFELTNTTPTAIYRLD